MKFSEEKCPRCGMPFMAPAEYVKEVHTFHIPIGCPRGHLYWYSGTKNKPMEKQIVNSTPQKTVAKKIRFQFAGKEKPKAKFVFK